MATPAEIQAALSGSAVGARIVIAEEKLTADDTKSEFYVLGGLDAIGRARWCVTPFADNAATQAASILTQLRA